MEIVGSEGREGIGTVTGMIEKESEGKDGSGMEMENPIVGRLGSDTLGSRMGGIEKEMLGSDGSGIETENPIVGSDGNDTDGKTIGGTVRVGNAKLQPKGLYVMVPTTGTPPPPPIAPVAVPVTCAPATIPE